ncbi:MAG: peptidylprolyl isomerase [Oscillospiraceae bacterium]|nr:peptidylprolyl isomerase [Oscillospiraceae bacterium]
MLKNRLLSALLAAAVSFSLGAAILRFTPAAPAYNPTQLEQGITYDAVGVSGGETILTVDGNTAPAELLTYQIGYSCAYLDYMLRSFNGTGLDLSEPLPGGGDARQTILDESVDLVKQQLVLENLAERYGVTVSAEDEAGMAEQRAADIAQFGEEGYQAEIYKLGLSEASYARMLRAEALYQAFHDAYNTPGNALYADDDVLHAYAAGAGYITADHILLSTVDPATMEPLDDETVAEKRALAEDLLARLRSSDDPLADFAALAEEYGEDPGRDAAGYTFAQGDMVESFDAAARALGENEISDIVESDYGYHIILRRPLDAAAAVEIVRDTYFDVFFTAEVDRAEAEVSPLVERFDVAAIYDALRAAQGAE